MSNTTTQTGHAPQGQVTTSPARIAHLTSKLCTTAQCKVELVVIARGLSWWVARVENELGALRIEHDYRRRDVRAFYCEDVKTWAVAIVRD